MDRQPTTIQSPEELLDQAVGNDSIEELNRALDLGQSIYTKDIGDGSFSFFINTALENILRKPSLSLLTYLLDYGKVSTSDIMPIAVSKSASQPLVDALVAHGWDANQAGPKNMLHRGMRLIDFVVGPYHDEKLASWLVEEKNVFVDGGENDLEYEIYPMPPPLLETCAKYGSVELFKFLQERGARLSQRTLHQAVLIAADRGMHFQNTKSVGSVEDETRKNNSEMLRFLVDELGLDVNALDSQIDHRLHHWGTPICYAATAEKGAGVVRWLLEQGADPTAKGPFTGFDAWAVANLNHRIETLQVLSEWKKGKV